jgi:diguanylate cyclase (GGDEF)-like protein
VRRRSEDAESKGERIARARVSTVGIVMAAGALALYVAVMRGHDHPFQSSVRVPWLLIALGVAIADRCSLDVQFRGNSLTFTPDDVLFVVGLFTVSPSRLVAAYVLGAAISLGVIRRVDPYKLLFNICTWTTSAIVAIVVFRSIAGGSDPFGPRNWVAALAGTTSSALIAITAISIAIAIVEGRSVFESMRLGMFGAMGTAFDTLLGLAAVIFLSRSPWTLILLGGPIGGVIFVYRAYVTETSRSRSLQFLFTSSELLAGARDFEDGLVALLDFTRDTFHAELAEVVLLGDADFDSAQAYRTCLGPGDRRCSLATVDDEIVAPLLRIAPSLEQAARYTPGANDDLAVREGMHVGSALVAALRGEAGVRGAVFVARDRRAHPEPFADEEIHLLEAFVNQLETSIEKSRLSSSLTKLRALEQKLAHQAYHDSLTGLANRALFHERVQEALDSAAETGRSVAVLFIDLDDFKTVNDTLGHSAGDALLAEVGVRIASCIGNNALAARLGGDEFGVLLPSVLHEFEARVVADRVLVALGDPISVDGESIITHASIGISSHQGATDAAELMKHADVAMYTAKRNGKGRFDEFQPSMSLTVARRHQVRVGLERAIAQGEFTVHYQPVVNVAEGTILGTEALVRWKDPARGLTLPSEFVGVAEETGLIVPIGRFVLHEACRQAAKWGSVTPGLRVFVNLSVRQLMDPDIVNDVKSALATAGLEPHRLYLEVTETAIMHDIDEAKATLHALKRIGVGLAIDDFGTGFSSLSRLRALPIDVLKIAKPIVDAICDSEADSKFVKTIIELGHVIGLEVVAEGVEHVEQYAQLVDMGCDMVQGHYCAASADPAATERAFLTSVTPRSDYSEKLALSSRSV